MLTILLQIGLFFSGTAETFYTSNFGYSAGVQVETATKLHRVGYHRQEATINCEGYWFRHGLTTDINVLNVDDIAIFYVGFRLSTSNDQFYEFTPHLTLAWRFCRWLEAPIQLSQYKSRTVGSIGLRFMLRPTRQTNKVQNSFRPPLQPSKNNRAFTHQ
jgi:hypothetical protein